MHTIPPRLGWLQVKIVGSGDYQMSWGQGYDNIHIYNKVLGPGMRSEAQHGIDEAFGHPQVWGYVDRDMRVA